MRFIRFWVNVFKILRAMFVLWLLEKLTYEENLPLTCHGRYIAERGDIAVLQSIDGRNEIAHVTGQGEGLTVYMRIYRRPK